MRFRKPKDFKSYQSTWIWKINLWLPLYGILQLIKFVITLLTAITIGIFWYPAKWITILEYWLLDDRVRYFYMEKGKK